ncbi:hypothetical protein HDU96_004545, partial [Phlyctochytrium bullatum]
LVAERVYLNLLGSGDVSIDDKMDVVKCDGWLHKYDTFCKNLLLLIHLSYGLPARGTELTTIKMVNCEDGPRNLYLHGRVFYLFTIYKKTTSLHGNIQPIVRYLTPEVSNIVFSLIVVLRPMWSFLQAGMQKAQSLEGDVLAAPACFYKQEESETKKIYNAFKEVFAKATGNELLMSDYRHLAIALMRENGIKMSIADDYITFLNSQTGHGDHIAAQHYAVDGGVPAGLIANDLKSFYDISFRWALMLGLVDRADYKFGPKVANDLQQHVQDVKRIQALLDPVLVNSKEEVANNISNAARKCLVDLYGIHAHFKSAEQKRAVCYVLEGRNDVVVHMPTGSGKSLCIMIPA